MTQPQPTIQFADGKGDVTVCVPPLHIDSSMLSTLGACQRKYLWSYIHNLRAPGVSIHLTAGGAIAAGLDAARKSLFAGSSYDEAIYHAFVAFSKAWGNAPMFWGEGKSFSNSFEALELYLSTYPPLTDIIQPVRIGDNKPATEFTFAIPLPVAHISGDPYIFTGRFDMLGIYNNERMVIVDEKTTSSLGASWANQWKLRGQFMGYIWACQQLGYKVDTVFVRGIGLLKTQVNFLTALEQFPQWMIERWFTETCNKLHTLNWIATHNEWRYSFGDACTSYGGCQYNTLCMANQPEQWMSQYAVEVWDPLHKGGE